MTVRFRQNPDTFYVEEIPLYPPSGSGEHLLLTVRKSGISTPFLVREILKRYHLKEVEIGTAGNKDRDAVSVQAISVPARIEKRIGKALSDLGVDVLSAARHDQKLRTGHLRGNLFRIRLTADAPSDIDTLRSAIETISREGMPNPFGPQRFGDGSAADEGRLVFLGRRTASGFRKSRFAVSAFQSRIFNQVLEERLCRGYYPGPVDGDLMVKHDTGGLFPVGGSDEETAERTRRLEISPTGPLPGRKSPLPSGGILELEREIMERNGVTLSDLPHVKPPGVRRPIRVPVPEISLDETDGPQRPLLILTLPPGSYATSLLGHLGVSLEYAAR